MARFRYSGTGWAVCNPIHVLGLQIEAVWPERHGADGTLAGGGHSIWPASDHGADPNGVVRALDMGEVVEDQGALLVEQLVASRDDRIAYIIHENRMWRSYSKPGIPPWTPAPYTGPNGHIDHVHVSTLRDHSVDQDATPFAINLEGVGMFTVKEWQEMLNEAGRTDADGNPLVEDGIKGPKTRFALVSSLTEDKLADHPHPDLAPVEWTKDRIAEATRNMIEYGDVIKTRRPPS